MKATLITPSKINLFLKIAGKRADNYHNIETVFLPLNDICDIISIEDTKCLSNGISISCTNPEVPCDEKNLCYKAARLYIEKAEIKPTLKIGIGKNIPVTAGMGGGSSDAAAVLLILQDIYKAFKPEELSDLALSIGADVPFFLNPLPSAGYGKGEILHPLKIGKDFKVVICAPQFPVSAAWAYKNLQKPRPCDKLNINELINCLERGDYSSLSRFVENDLASALYKKFPLLQSLRKKLLDTGLDAVQITGSGPTIFGITEDESIALKAVEHMRNKYGAALMLAESSIMHSARGIQYV